MASPMSVWRSLMFTEFSPTQWGRGSYLHYLVGLGQAWTRGSWLWPGFEAIATGLLAVIYIAAPFTSTTMLGVFMALCGGLWAL